MTTASRRSVAKLSTPGDIVATVPSLCGFSPRDSVVVLSLRGRRKRLGLTIRLDLPPPETEREAAEVLAERVVHDGGAAAVVVVFGQARRPELVAAVVESCEQRDLLVAEALHVDDGRWSSYTCAGSCCPVTGTPVPQAPALVEAHRALNGTAVLDTREDLVRSLAPPVLLQAEAARQALEDATAAWLEQRRERGAARARQADLDRARAALDGVADGGSVDLATAAGLAAVLHDVLVRDEIATWALERSDALLSLLEQVLRQVVPPYDAPACALLAWVAYARGDGSRANVALDRALATDPGCLLALLLREGLDGGMPPHEVRAILRDTAAALRAPA